MRQRILDSGEPPRGYFYPADREDKHLNDRGHYAVAGWLLEELRELGLSAHPPPTPWSALCAPRLRRLAYRIRSLPREEFTGASARRRRGLTRKALAAADRLQECRPEAALEELGELLERIDGVGEDSFALESKAGAELIGQVVHSIATLEGTACGECPVP